MPNYLIDLFINILANVMFWLVLGLGFHCIIRRTQSEFLRFFGLEHNRKLIVYLSNLWLPTMTKKPPGCIVAGQEFKVPKTLGALFGSAPFRLPELVRGLVDSFWIGSKLDVDHRVSPLDGGVEPGSSMIVVGATTKNSVRRDYLNKGMIYVTIAGEPAERPSDIHVNPLEQRFIVMRGKLKGESLQRNGDHNLAIVERIRDEKNDIIVFMCTGSHGDSSWAATEYLVRHWHELFTRFRDKSFARCLWFPYTAGPMEDYSEPCHVHDPP